MNLAPPRDHETVQQNFDRERACQPFMDADYRRRGHTILSREGTREYDAILLLKGRREERIEEKFRDTDYGDLLIEIVQDVCTGDLGWFYHTRCDFLHYAICPRWQQLAYYWRLDWALFKEWFCDTHLTDRRFPKAQTSVLGYGLTLNICVSPADIPDSMKQRCEAAS